METSLNRLITALAFVLFAASLQAQTPTFKLQWDQSEPLATVQGFQYTLKVDTSTPTLLTPTCTVQGASTRCTAPLPAMATGSHTLQLTAFNGFGSTASDPLTGVAPSKASGMTITVIITIP